MSSSSEQPHNGSDAIYDKAHSSERRSHVPATGMTGVEGTGSVDEDENDMDDTLVDWIVAPWGPHHSQPHHAQSNKIRTAKYTWYNFLPKNLWIQFHRVANVYFLFMACLNFIPAIGSFAPIIGFMPLVFVLSVTAVKDAVEDGRRKTQDKEINNGAARVVVEDGDHRHRRHSTAGLLEQPEGSADLRRVGKSGRVCDVAWQDVAVGDIVVLKNGDMMPADVLLLHSSDPSGLAFVETANLDGETNLKARSVFFDQSVAPNGAEYETQDSNGNITSPPFDPERFKSVKVQAEGPSLKIYEFNGFVDFEGTRYLLSAENLLLRDCVLRHTEEVYGVVIYTGHQTKAMLNNTGPRYKRSKLERDINWGVLLVIAILIALCITGAIASYVYNKRHDLRLIPYDKFRYETGDPNLGLDAFERYWTWMVLLQAMIPLALYVSIELVKLMQVYLINVDIHLYDETTNTPMLCRALNITEDLGQIEYVFSDKTGTLTQNLMRFRCCSINGIVYDHGFVELSDGDIDLKSDLPLDAALLQVIDSENAVETNTGEVHGFLMCLALCNTVRPVFASDAIKEQALTERDWQQSDVEFEAESPDEAALVAVANAYKYSLVSTTNTTRVVNIGGSLRSFELLATLEFDSTRKRMSVLIREGDKVTMYCKGADSAIFKILAASNTVKMRKATEEHIDRFACQGLRTLVLAKRELPVEYANDWLRRFDEARSSLKTREDATAELVKELEVDMTLLGATGVEDALQVGVPQTIESLRGGGIVVWVLTGDKQETAIQIAKTCKLVSDDMDLLVLNSKKAKAPPVDELDVAAVAAHDSACVAEVLELIAETKSKIRALETSNTMDTPTSVALVVDGATLAYCLNEKVTEAFVELTSECTSIVACRSTPFQKAQIVDTVKKALKVMTLAIGDGANDASMIQSADVGVGISGREGRQAVMASDFAISQFRFLERLLFVHGTWNYERTSLLVLYFFWKNTLYNVILFMFGPVSLFSGTVYTEQLSYLMYNFLFTSLPQIWSAAYDRPISADTLLANPHLYQRGRLSQAFDVKLAAWYVADGIYNSIILFLIPYGALKNSDAALLELGMVSLWCSVLVANIWTLIECWTIDWVQMTLQGVMLFAWFALNLMYFSESFVSFVGLVPSPIGVFSATWSAGWFWGTVLLTLAFTTGLRMLFKTIKLQFFPNSMERARTWELLMSKNATVTDGSSVTPQPVVSGKKGSFDIPRTPPLASDLNPKNRKIVNEDML
eukprot:m.20377 g.20377  ORF g.20377 m.20377 type:complete len:1248 (-) comp12127_c0_seq2:472-4215(-)